MAIGPNKPRVIYSANARIWLNELDGTTGSRTLAGIPEKRLTRLREFGIDLFWPIGIWPTGPKSTKVARNHAGLQEEYRRVLPDFAQEDVGGSPYAIATYTVDTALGGASALAEFRAKLRRNGIGLILDFVVNHTGLDHPWLMERPDLYVQGTAEDAEQAPDSFFTVDTLHGLRVIAHGRDPYFPSWTDTAQLNLFNPETRQVLSAELERLAGQCDGLRCDMAMLALSSIYRQTWASQRSATVESHSPDEEFWPAAIAAVHRRYPEFLFIAEVYWGLEDALRQVGFQYTYDKTLYDRLVHGNAEGLRVHLRADVGWQTGCVRFIETHDELPAAVPLPWDRHKAAAMLIATVPGLTLIHDGQIEGHVNRIPIQLCRRGAERPNRMVLEFYQALLQMLAADKVVRRGNWSLLPARSAWSENPTWAHFVVYFWGSQGEQLRLVIVNFAETQGQCYVDLSPMRLNPAHREFEFSDQFTMGNKAVYRYSAEQLLRDGLYVDLPPFGFHFFEVSPP